MQKQFMRLLVWFLLLWPAIAAGTESELAVATSLEQVDVNIRYRGEEIQLFGEVQPGAEVLIQVTSPPETVNVRKKDKVLGFVWMNVERAEISQVPGYYQVVASAPLDRFSSEIQELTGIDGNYRFVRERARVEPADADAPSFLDGYIQLKEKQKLYGHQEKAVDIIKGRLFRAEVRLPSRAPIGEYRVQITTVRNDQVVGHGTSSLRVEQIGVQQWVTTMARSHAALYGLGAVAIALLAGFGVGLIFKGEYDS